MNMNDATTMKTSNSSNISFLPLKRGNESPDRTMTVRRKTTTGKFKGVVEQQNGHWGAQIYADHQRIWLGTFKSAAEAATAYDSASIKLRVSEVNSYRNFPLNDVTVHEPAFQATLPTETVLSMIRDGSYPHTFGDYLSYVSQKVGSRTNISGSKRSHESSKYFACTLFQKELTPSDVGKLNRLVIPKKHAVKHLPFISDYRTKRENGDAEDVEVVFYDGSMRQWKFRYSYWRSSQSFVFTRGWNGFVKEKNLKEKDVLFFSACSFRSNVELLEGQSKEFLMIDVHSFSGNGFVALEEVSMSFDESLEREMKTENLLKDEETQSEEKKGGFVLFGVRIQ